MRSPTPPLAAVDTAGAEAWPGRILAARADQQARRLPLSQVTVVINATLVAVVLGGAGPIRIWVALVLAVVALRLSAWVAHRRGPERITPLRWGRLHVAGAAANGLLWGVLPVFFFAPASIAQHLFLCAVLVGMVAGSAASTSGHPAAFGAFALPALAPLAYLLASSADALERTAAVLVVIFAAAMWFLARTTARNLTASLVHRFRNDALLEQLADVNAGLERTVRQRTGELIELELRLAGSALLASVGSLTAAVAHDINNPLASLLSSLRVVEEELRAGPVAMTPAGREALEDVRACADRVRVIVRSLGDMARDEGRLGSLELREILESCLEVAAPDLRGRVRVARDLAGSFRVLGDRGSLSRMFLGLILSLARQLPPGELATHELRIAFAPPDGQTTTVAITCQPPPAPGERASDHGGEDPSLSPVHAIAARLGGSIVVRSDGSGFLVLLPVQGA